MHQFFKRKKGKKKVVALAEVSKEVQFFLKKYNLTRLELYVPDFTAGF
jgi:hypothetical protein